MYLHGCGETADSLYMSWKEVFYGGYPEYAAANNLILLMPQTQGSWFNAFECFDIYNYNSWWDENQFVTKKGVQIGAFKRMLDRVTESRSESYYYGARDISNIEGFDEFLFDFWRSYHALPGWIETFTWQSIFGILFWFFGLFAA